MAGKVGNFQVNKQERACLMEDELLILRHSGELPEIAYHSSLYYLTADQDGPGLILTEDELKMLQEAAVKRCQQIVLRDLNPENRDLRLYRGPRRSIWNWQRYCTFCQRLGRQRDNAFKERVARALTGFLRQEVADAQQGKRKTCINCTSEELLAFAREIGVAENTLAEGWQALCQGPPGC
jgi:hypothetical protein